MGDEYPCPHCGAMNPESTGYLRITCRVCGGQYEARHHVSSTSIAELAKQVSPDDAEMAAMTECPHQEAVFWNPYNHVVQCHRCGEVFVPGSAATPADAIMGFAAWLTSRPERVGPFSRFDDAALMVELVKRFCDFNGWPDVGPNFPHTFRMPTDGGLTPTLMPEPEDVPLLLAEVEQRQAREAALLAVVRKVAEADNSDHSVCYQLCSYDMHWTDDDRQIMTHNAPCVAEQALALLKEMSDD